MFGARGYGPEAHEPMDSRPAKRPRNLSAMPDDRAHYRDGAPTLSAAEFPPPRRLDIQVIGPANAASKGREDKNNRKLSCKECRRLKLKCDRVFPCQSCVKRGCGSLCPEGALTSGRGSRFILANTEQLHEKISQLSDRVRQLEEALHDLQSAVTSQPHPLLAPELLKIKTSQELYGATGTSSTQAPLTTPNHSHHHEHNNVHPVAGPSRGDDRLRESVSELSLDHRSDHYANAMDLDARRESTPPEVPPDILQLSSTFPFPWSLDLKIRKRIRDTLPPREDALAICEEARRNALWQYNLDSSETFIPNLVHYVYTTQIELLSPRRLALLLMVLSIGSLVDLNRPLGSLHGEAYHHLARAAVCEIPLMEEPDFDCLHALFFMIWYHLIFSDNKKAIGYAWNLMGFVAKLAQGLGLHRDAPRLKLIPEEHEKRRAVFWELLNMDCRMSLSLGRPPSLSLAHVDVQPPTYTGPGIYVPQQEIMYHEWKHGFFIKCLSPVLEAMIAKEPADYVHIVELDKSVRDYAVPFILDIDAARATDSPPPRFLRMQQATVSLSRELALLQLHRKYFTRAMSDSAAFDLNHPHAPSVFATYMSASALVSTVDTLFSHEQQLSARFLHFWFNSFSASVTLSLLISRAPSTPLAHHALQSLERVCQLFRRAAVILPFSSKALPVMQKLLDKSRRTLSQHPATYNRLDAETKKTLSNSFSGVHTFLTENAERIMSSAAATGSSGSLSRILDSPPSDSSMAGCQLPLPSTDSWLPDIYQFSSIGLGLEDRYNHPTTQPHSTPFVPSSPRVAETKDFNFDHGDITVGLVEETSYMAWF